MCPERRVPCGPQEVCSQPVPWLRGERDRDSGYMEGGAAGMQGGGRIRGRVHECLFLSCPILPSVSLPALSHKLPEAQQSSQ